MRWLKALVIVMGLLIVVGLVAVAYGIARNAEKLTVSEAQPRAATFGERTLDAPPGCRFAEALPLGDSQLLIRLEGLPERGCQQVLVLDLADGSLRGRLILPQQ